MLSRKNIVSLFAVASVVLLLVTEVRAAEEGAASLNTEPPVILTNDGTHDGNGSATAPVTESATASAGQEAPAVSSVPVQSATSPATASITPPATSPAVAVGAAPAVATPALPAETVNTPPVAPGEVGKQVVEINERMALLSAQLAELELKAKIAVKVEEINSIGKKDKTEEKKSPELVSPFGQGFMNQGPNMMAPSQPANVVLPKQGSSASKAIPLIQSIEGVDGHLKAILRVSGQGTKTVRVGQTVAGWVVRDIRIDGVTVQKGKIVQDLYFSDSSGMGGGASDEKETLSQSPVSGSNMFGGASPASMGIEPLTLK